MRVPRLQLLIALVVCAAIYAVHRSTREIRPAYASLGVAITGKFTLEGQYPGEKIPRAAPLRRWGSWSGSDENLGTLRLGPFPAPAMLSFAVGGFPSMAGNTIFVELGGTTERLPITVRNVGERWLLIDLILPAPWVGRPIVLVAIDAATKMGGWISITEPVRGGAGEGNGAFFEALAAWSINGVLLGLMWLAALRWLNARTWVRPEWAPLVAAAGVAVCGYLAFWAFFFHANAGKIASAALLAAGAAGALWRRDTEPAFDREHAAIAGLLVTIGFFYLALLHLFPSSREFHDLAANRFREGLPGDNTLPHVAAAKLYRGVALRAPGADWLSSDRPPLQSGWQLLTWPVTAALELDDRRASGTAAVWLQSLWIAAMYALLRNLGLERRRAVAWIGVLALSGFFLLNTVFTWPKLAGGAFACGAFALWAAPAAGQRRPADFVIGALLAALAWLSHGGVAFAYLALAPWLAWRALRGELRGWLRAAGVFLLLALPWTAYQKFYDPPGNQLVKWHLGGQVEKDPRGAWETIRDGYRQRSWTDTVKAKRENFETQFTGNWSQLANFSPASAAGRRDDEFFHPARALTWWVVGLVLLPFALARSASRQRLAETGRLQWALAAWLVFTTILWCLLMFFGRHAVIHQGSYTTLLASFALLTVWIERAGSRLIWVVAVLQAATFLTTWAWANATIHGAPAGLPFVILAVLGIGAVMFHAQRETPGTCHAAPGPAPAPEHL